MKIFIAAVLCLIAVAAAHDEHQVASTHGTHVASNRGLKVLVPLLSSNHYGSYYGSGVGGGSYGAYYGGSYNNNYNHGFGRGFRKGHDRGGYRRGGLRNVGYGDYYHIDDVFYTDYYRNKYGGAYTPSLHYFQPYFRDVVGFYYEDRYGKHYKNEGRFFKHSGNYYNYDDYYNGYDDYIKHGFHGNYYSTVC